MHEHISLDSLEQRYSYFSAHRQEIKDIVDSVYSNLPRLHRHPCAEVCHE